MEKEIAQERMAVIGKVIRLARCTTMGDSIGSKAKQMEDKR